MAGGPLLVMAELVGRLFDWVIWVMAGQLLALGHLGHGRAADPKSPKTKRKREELAPGGRFAPADELASFRSFRSFGHRKKVAPARLSYFTL